MNTLLSRLRILVSTEMILLKAETSRRANRTLLMLGALGCVLLGILLANFSLFFVLTDQTLHASAAAWLALANFAVAAIPAFLARKSKAGPEELMVQEIRDLAHAELDDEFKQVTQEFSNVASTIKQIQQGGIGGLAPPALAAILPSLIKMLKEH